MSCFVCHTYIVIRQIFHSKLLCSGLVQGPNTGFSTFSISAIKINDYYLLIIHCVRFKNAVDHAKKVMFLHYRQLKITHKTIN